MPQKLDKKKLKKCQENCDNIYLIETVEEIKDIDFSGIQEVGIMAGASTPKESIKEVEEYLKCL